MILQHKMFYGHGETVVLRMLADGPSHPYRIRQEMAKCSKGYFCPSLGRIYPLLEVMEKHCLVRSKRVRGHGDQQRRQYTITAAGRRRLAIQTDEWHSFSEAMDRVLHHPI
jgi:PadR family transcriptional regulator, regulatory protein PadR